ncbi:MAG: ABC transporter ATP-binding protein [Bacilli bacterium]
MKKYILKYKKMLVVAVIMIAINVAMMLLQPKLLSTVLSKGVQNVNEQGLLSPDMDVVNKYGILLVLMAIVGLIAAIINAVVAARLSQSVGADIREDMFKKIQTFSFSDIESFKGSNLVVRIGNDVNQVQNALFIGILRLISLPLVFIGSFILAVLIFPNLWWIIVVEVIFVLIILSVINKFTFPLFIKYQDSLDKINASVKDNFIGSRVVKSFVQEDQEIEKFDKDVDVISKINMKIGMNFSIILPCFNLLGAASIIAAIYFASDKVVSDISELGNLVSYTNYMAMIFFTLTMSGFLMMTVSRASASFARINELLNYNSTEVFTDKEDISLYNDIEFKNVSFKYQGDDHHSLHNINFKVKKGEMIGIIGATGSGKSTLVNILSRLYSPQKGEILIGGVNLNEIKKSRIRNEISVVLQRPYLFSGTIKTNILDGNLCANEDEVAKSAKIAQAQEFILQKELSYNSIVYQRGSNFSGGQKQRISIARGLVKNPSILILDDSTSALDAKSEKLIKEGLDVEYQSTTKFIISQKISSIVHADKIIVLNAGSIDAIGTHKELIDSSSIYNEIYQSQKGAR